MRFFHKLRCNLARRRFERALDLVTKAEFDRMCAMQKFFHEYAIAPGDRIVLTFKENFGVCVEDSENRSNMFNQSEKDFDL